MPPKIAFFLLFPGVGMRTCFPDGIHIALKGGNKWTSDSSMNTTKSSGPAFSIASLMALIFAVASESF
jgi:hypothetical protein